MAIDIKSNYWNKSVNLYSMEHFVYSTVYKKGSNTRTNLIFFGWVNVFHQFTNNRCNISVLHTYLEIYPDKSFVSNGFLITAIFAADLVISWNAQPLKQNNRTTLPIQGVFWHTTSSNFYIH